jgi:hypothetical protein
MRRIKGTPHEDLCTFMITSRSLSLGMRNISHKIVEKIKTRILCSITFSFENRAVCEMIRKKYGTARQATDDNRIQWLGEHASMLLHTYTAYLVEVMKF